MASTRTLAPAKRRTTRTARRNQRVSVATPADLVSLEGQRTVLVVNLSEFGAMIEMTMPPQLDSEILLYCGTLEAEGTIVWRSPDHCGVRFHVPVSGDDVDCEALWSRRILDQLLQR